jgi:hypothetical protein
MLDRWSAQFEMSIMPQYQVTTYDHVLMTRIRNDLSLVVSWLVSLSAHSLKMQRLDGATDHCADCSRDCELGNKVVLSYVMIVDCEESKA